MNVCVPVFDSQVCACVCMYVCKELRVTVFSPAGTEGKNKLVPSRPGYLYALPSRHTKSGPPVPQPPTSPPCLAFPPSFHLVALSSLLFPSHSFPLPSTSFCSVYLLSSVSPCCVGRYVCVGGVADCMDEWMDVMVGECVGD